MILNAMGCPAGTLVTDKALQDETVCALLDLFFGDHDDDTIEHVPAVNQQINDNNKKRSYVKTLY